MFIDVWKVKWKLTVRLISLTKELRCSSHERKIGSVISEHELVIHSSNLALFSSFPSSRDLSFNIIYILETANNAEAESIVQKVLLIWEEFIFLRQFPCLGTTSCSKFFLPSVVWFLTGRIRCLSRLQSQFLFSSCFHYWQQIFQVEKQLFLSNKRSTKS